MQRVPILCCVVLQFCSRARAAANGSKCRCTFNETLKLLLADSFRLHLDLQRHEDGEEEFVGLVETACRVREGEVRQVVDDVLDASCGERRPVRVRHRDVEQLQKLTKRRLVHAADVAHRHDQKIQNRTTRCHCTTHAIQWPYDR